ncbi:MAG: hypothetical protein HY319_20465 [Armatimonadetes bacterium]|nr:hypothetical protein [Armatimonadota bacterium]
MVTGQRPLYLVFLSRALGLAGLAGMMVAMASGNGRSGMSAWEPLAVPAFFVFVLSLIHLGAFPLDYSFFGTHERTATPDEPVLERSTGGRVGNTKGTLYFFATRSGLGGWAMGRFFIPLARFRSLTMEGGYALLVHDSPEVRSPIRFPLSVGAPLVEALRDFQLNVRDDPSDSV